MRLIVLTAVISVAFIAPSLIAPSWGQTMAPARPGLMMQTADLTVRDGSDAGPAQTAVPGQADDASNVTDLPRIATHAPRRLGLPVPAETTAGDSQ
jgi:hypothetical protein